MTTNQLPIYTKRFNELTISDVPIVGGKNASLGEMYQKLTDQGVRIPDGFAITADAYWKFIADAGIEKEIKKTLKNIDNNNVKALKEKGSHIRKTIINSAFPEEILQAIADAYEKLSQEYKTRNLSVAVRSSATAEDAPDASFAGQQETYLNITGLDQLLLATKKCMASLFTDRSISYRIDKKIDLFDVALSVGVQKMARSDKASSGVMFTLDPESGFKNVIVINAAYGLGENVVQGSVTPDEFIVHKELLQKGFRPIVGKTLGSKERALIYTSNPNLPTKNVSVETARRHQFALTDDEILQLAEFGITIEKHYKRPMDIEWAKDGLDEQLYIVQARPETIHGAKTTNTYEEHHLKEKGEVLVEGAAIGNRIGQGSANTILTPRDMAKFKHGDVLVTDMTDPDWEPIMRQAKAIVTNRGGRTCFAGNTQLLTNHGFMSIENVVDEYNQRSIQVLSLNRKTLKLEWKPVTDGMQRVAKTISVSISQTGRMADNNLELTPDHKMITFKNRRLIDQEIQHIIKNQDYLLSTQKIPAPGYHNLDPKLAYLMGAIFTDGSVYTSRTHGKVQIIQKNTPSKQAFIKRVHTYFADLFDYQLKTSQKKPSTGRIRGKAVRGSANAYRCYSKEIATKFKQEKEKLVTTMLYANETTLFNFLAGVIDGDGTYNKDSHRLSIYCSNDTLWQAISIACLRLNISFKSFTNRNIHHIQIVTRLDEILSFTARVKASSNQPARNMGWHLFSARQLLNDIIDRVNYRGRIKPYIKNNLLIDADKILNNLIPMIKGQPENHELTNISKSSLSMLRVNQLGTTTQQPVYNITVEDNHNYVVFTSRLTPIIANNCHAAIVSRELGIPCVVGTEKATEVIKDEQEITVSCAEGEIGRIYDGLLKVEVKTINLGEFVQPKTKIMMNMGVPREAFSLASIPNSGIGLAREEFIIANFIKVHPLALMNYPNIEDKEAKTTIETLTYGYDDKSQFFIDQLAWGMGRLAASVYPKDIIVRTSDFKTNEYASLVGGKEFEPQEPNPMIGWRGASRYYDPKYEPAFRLECQAFKKLREEMGFTNVKIMIPFCRTIEEGEKVLAIMKEEGLTQGENNLEVYVMVEIPANVILADQFAQLFDGFSIGTNDLTQLSLGVDRDSSIVSHIYDERNETVKTLVRLAIQAAKSNKIKIGICGDAPSTFPEFAQFLVEQGIDSISLSPDAVFTTTLKILEEEKKQEEK